MNYDNDNTDVIRPTAMPGDEQGKEQQAVAKGIVRQQKRRSRQALPETTAGHSMKEKAVLDVAEALEGFVLAVENSKGGRKPLWYQHIIRMKRTQAAEIALTVAMDGIGKDWSLNALFSHQGMTFHTHLFHVVLTESPESADERRANRRISKDLDERTRMNVNAPANRRDYALQKAKALGFEWSEWPEDVVRSVGAILISAVYAGCDHFHTQIVPRANENFDVTQVGTKSEQAKTFKERFIGLTDEAQQHLEEHNELLDGLSPLFAPMLTEPNPWHLDSDGPYKDPALAKLVPMVKHCGPDQKKAIKEAQESGQLDQCMEALNLLQSVPYEVNEYVVEAVEWLMDSDNAKKVDSFPTLVKHTVPKRMDKAEFDLLDTDEQIDKYVEREELVKGNREAVANRLNINRHLGEARELLVFDRFHLPHQFDTRSRVYHTSEFGHHANDYLRGMFMFKNKTEITAENSKFLALQLANTYGDGPNKLGLDKKSFDVRQEWVEAHVDEIMEAGFDYKAGFEFWSQADDSCQFLAACRDYAMYCKTVEDGKAYFSGLPIGLDATQSGIQHYAAASLNEADGFLVNLKENSEPQDLYTACMDLANRLIDNDITRLEEMDLGDPANDNEEPTPEVVKLRKQLVNAKLLKSPEGKLSRKVVKRNCMTWAYSSRRYGFAKQLQKDWMADLSKKVRDPEHPMTEHPFGKDRGHSTSHYLAGINERAISTVVKSAADGMAFFQKCAAALAEEGKHLKFVTPMGFPMFQYYRTETGTRRQKIWLFDRETRLVDKTARASFRCYDESVKRAKSINAVSPNIIHSMDASHLMLTVLTCSANGVRDLMVVHDSFSTTVGNAQTMWDSIRDSFVQLYDGYCVYTDLLEQVKEQLDDPDNADLPEQIPEKGTLDIHEVKNSPYFCC